MLTDPRMRRCTLHVVRVLGLSYLIAPSMRFASADAGSSASAVSSSARAAAAFCELQVGLGKRDAGRRGVRAPDRNLQRVDRLLRTAGAQVDPADQQVRLRLVGRQVDGAPQLHHRLAVLPRARTAGGRDRDGTPRARAARAARC